MWLNGDVGRGGGVGPDITFVLLSEPMGKIWEIIILNICVNCTVVILNICVNCTAVILNICVKKSRQKVMI